jgi:hypothetical protein
LLGKTIHKKKILQQDKKLERIDEPERGIQNLRKRLVPSGLVELLLGLS